MLLEDQKPCCLWRLMYKCADDHAYIPLGREVYLLLQHRRNDTIAGLLRLYQMARLSRTVFDKHEGCYLGFTMELA
jgi:hypothetical protein